MPRRGRLSGRPGGSRLFSAAAMARVPYFASVLPHVVRMEPGLAEVRVPKWFFVYNHLHTVHAIASCNAAEIAIGMLMEATVPRSHRSIPKAMTVQYLGKATTSLHARAQLDPPDFSQIADGVDLVVPVSITDRSGNEVVHADIATWVTPSRWPRPRYVPWPLRTRPRVRFADLVHQRAPWLRYLITSADPPIDPDDVEVPVGGGFHCGPPYSRSAALPRTTPLSQGTNSAAYGDVKTTSS